MTRRSVWFLSSWLCVGSWVDRGSGQGRAVYDGRETRVQGFYGQLKKERKKAVVRTAGPRDDSTNYHGTDLEEVGL
jgi:hypothetical protein